MSLRAREARPQGSRASRERAALWACCGFPEWGDFDLAAGHSTPGHAKTPACETGVFESSDHSRW